jgi:hypothetical protein
MSISAELRNGELDSALFDVTQGSVLAEKVVRRVKSLVAMEGGVESEIEFITSHFSQISSSNIYELDYKIMNAVVRHGKMQIGSENSLYEIREKYTSLDARYFELFDLIHFECLSSVATSFISTSCRTRSNASPSRIGSRCSSPFDCFSLKDEDPL